PASALGAVVTVGDSLHNLAAIGTLNVQGNGTTTVKVDDSSNLQKSFELAFSQPVVSQYTIGSGQLTRSVMLGLAPGSPLPTHPPPPSPSAPLTYSGLATLALLVRPHGLSTTQINTPALHGALPI